MYGPPGPKCLFQTAIYQHSRLPGPTYVIAQTPFLKDGRRAPAYGTETKRLAFQPAMRICNEPLHHNT